MSSIEHKPNIGRVLWLLRDPFAALTLASHRRAWPAHKFRRRYPDWGRWGLSAFYARNDSDVDDLAADRLATAEHEERPNPYHESD